MIYELIAQIKTLNQLSAGSTLKKKLKTQSRINLHSDNVNHYKKFELSDEEKHQ